MVALLCRSAKLTKSIPGPILLLRAWRTVAWNSSPPKVVSPLEITVFCGLIGAPFLVTLVTPPFVYHSFHVDYFFKMGYKRTQFYGCLKRTFMIHHGQKAWFSTQRFGDWFFLQPRWWRTFWPPYLGVGSSWVASSYGPQENIDAWWAYGNLYSFVSQIQAYTELIHYQNVSKYALKGRHKTVGDVFPDRVKIRGCPEAKAKCLESLQPQRPWQNLSKKCWSFESFCTVFNQKKIIYMA